MTEKRNITKPLLTVLQEMMDFSVLANPLFLLVCVSNVLGFLALYIPYIYLPNAMTSKVSIIAGIMHNTE